MNQAVALPPPVSADRVAQDEPAIVIKGLARRFGEKTVLKDFDLEVPAGQFLAIVGKSGCGKSTLLRLIAGLDKPDSGSISLNYQGQDTRARVMFQDARLLPWARVIDNVSVGLGEEQGAPYASDLARKALDGVGLSDRAEEWPAVLSGGQKQRVALARALVSRPHVLALDEPLGALDALTRIGMQALIERVWRDEKFTAILVTHDVAEAVALADRIILIDEGTIALDLEINLPRPRRRGSVELAVLEEQILDRILGSELNRPEWVI
jgi:sulfonate transport system ATP-binding protein